MKFSELKQYLREAITDPEMIDDDMHQYVPKDGYALFSPQRHEDGEPYDAYVGSIIAFNGTEGEGPITEFHFAEIRMLCPYGEVSYLGASADPDEIDVNISIYTHLLTD